MGWWGLGNGGPAASIGKQAAKEQCPMLKISTKATKCQMGGVCVRNGQPVGMASVTMRPAFWYCTPAAVMAAT